MMASAKLSGGSNLRFDLLHVAGGGGGNMHIILNIMNIIYVQLRKCLLQNLCLKDSNNYLQNL